MKKSFPFRFAKEQDCIVSQTSSINTNALITMNTTREKYLNKKKKKMFKSTETK